MDLTSEGAASFLKQGDPKSSKSDHDLGLKQTWWFGAKELGLPIFRTSQI